MRHMGNSGKTAIGAFLAALALLVLTGVTLHETVLVWFLAASTAAYVACVAEVVVRRRHRTLVASGIGSILFIAFGIAFLRQWGLAFNSDPDALSTPVDSEHPDLYFYLAAASGAVTLLLLFAGTVLPGRGGTRRGANYAPRRRPPWASRGPARGPASRGAASRGAASTGAPAGDPSRRVPSTRGASSGTSAPRPAPRDSASRTAASRPAAPRAAPRAAAKAPSVKAPAAKAPAAKASSVKSPPKSPAGPAARSSTRR
ncbi:hypothetical protein [Arthrobacter sp. UYEF20]|uniref:hypothetical protein n=1 Tax=Arthrobacter sp. UYEF20 TaxID=1756363 RepID=UPI00339371CA